jgi:hypothetical protein
MFLYKYVLNPISRKGKILPKKKSITQSAESAEIARQTRYVADHDLRVHTRAARIRWLQRNRHKLRKRCQEITGDNGGSSQITPIITTLTRTSKEDATGSIWMRLKMRDRFYGSARVEKIWRCWSMSESK